MFMFIFFSAC
jgi:hypothetical protein